MTTLCWMVGIHVLAASALFVFDWGALVVATGLGFWTGIGITLGYHRLLTHQSFKTRKWLEYSLVYCGLHACQVLWLYHYMHMYACLICCPL